LAQGSVFVAFLNFIFDNEVIMKLLIVVVGLVVGEVYSDLLVSEEFQQKALTKKHDHFWSVINAAAQQGDIGEAVEGLMACVNDLPEEHVKPMLVDSLEHLQVGAAGAGMLGSVASTTAETAMSEGPNEKGIRSPQDFFAKLYNSFVGEETYDYQKKLQAQVVERQKRVTDILKVAQGANVLQEIRKAKNLAFDVMKWDIYTPKELRNGAKSSKESKEIADKIVELQAQVRRGYLGVITASALELAADVVGVKQPAGRVVLPVEANPSPTLREAPERLTLTV